MRRRAAMALSLTALLATPVLFAQAVQPAGSPTLDRIRAAGRIRLGYRTDARPFAFKSGSGDPTGYSVELCQSIAQAVQASPGLSGAKLEWIPVTTDDRFEAVRQGRVDVLCGAETITLSRRELASFSIPIFPGGIGALVRSDAPARLREVLAGRGQVFRPVWRAAATQVLQSRDFATVQGTTADTWLAQRMQDLNVIAGVTHVSGYDAGIQSVIDRRADAFFGERAVLLDAAKRHASSRNLNVIDRLFTYEPLALAFARDDAEFRLLVDRTLSHAYASGSIAALYTKWFGEPDEDTLTFFRWNTLPD